MMKKTTLFLACMSLIGLIGCQQHEGTSDSTSKQETSYRGEHIKGEDIGGADILDDGGEIKEGEYDERVVDVEVSGEHQIILGDDSSIGKVEFVGTFLAEWTNQGRTYKRIRHPEAGNETIFTLDFKDATDNNVGVMLNLINNRRHTGVAVSSDKNNWTTIGYAETTDDYKGIRCDFLEHAEELLGSPVADANLVHCYYGLSKYLTGTKILYIKTFFTEEYENSLPSITGSDVIAHISYFDHFKTIVSKL